MNKTIRQEAPNRQGATLTEGMAQVARAARTTAPEQAALARAARAAAASTPVPSVTLDRRC